MAEKESLLNSLLGLSMIVEARDPYTGGHLWPKLLAQHVGLSRCDIALCEVGGFLHDLGKVGVPDAILRSASETLPDHRRVTVIQRKEWQRR